MTRGEFNEIQSEYQCWSCKRIGSVVVLPHPSDGTHPGKLVCGEETCTAFHFWLSKEKNKEKRPPIPKLVRDEVWRKWGNTCSHCGIRAEDLAFLGVMRTVQHAPPYRDEKENSQLLPYCEWCQQRSESESKRIRIMVERLRAGKR